MNNKSQIAVAKSYAKIMAESGYTPPLREKNIKVLGKQALGMFLVGTHSMESANYISEFDKNTWFYIERKKTNQSLFKLGIKKISKNNILIVKFNNKGLVKNKKLIDLNNMNDVKYVKNTTTKKYKQNNTVYKILSSLREKANASVRRNRSKK